MWHMKDNIKSKPQGVSQIARFRAKYVIFGVHKRAKYVRTDKYARIPCICTQKGLKMECGVMDTSLHICSWSGIVALACYYALAS